MKDRLTPKKLPNGKWGLDFYQFDPVEQRRIRPRLTFSTRADAMEYAKRPELRSRLDRPKLQVAAGTINELIEAFYQTIAFLELEEPSKVRYRQIISRFVVFCEQIGVNRAGDFSQDQAREYQRVIYDQCIGKGRKHNLDLISRLFEENLHRSIPSIRRNPFKGLQWPKERGGKPKPRFFTAHELKALFSVMDSFEASVFSLLLHSGMRSSECLGLKWTDVSTERLEIQRQFSKGMIKKCKGKLYRVVPVNNSLRSALEVLREYSDSEFVVPTTLRNKSHSLLRLFDQIKRRTVTKHPALADDLLTKEMQRRCTVHTFRKTFASLILQSGEPIAMVSELLGHSSIQTTQDHYGAISFQSTRPVTAALDTVDLTVSVDKEVVRKKQNPAFQPGFGHYSYARSEGGT